MISLQRNTKKELVPAKGKRIKKNTIYTPNQNEDYKLSRSKLQDFKTCPKCFYLDRVKGLAAPTIPQYSLNTLTDILLKKEFDVCRAKGLPHRIFKKYSLDYLLPFQHDDISVWQDSLHGGLKARFRDTNIILYGGIDDIWLDTRNKELVVVDYKSQTKDKTPNAETYLEDPYHEGYKIQLDFYGFLLSEMGFMVSDTGYFFVCNAIRDVDGFFGKMEFEETLIPYKLKVNYIPKLVSEMINVMNSEMIPKSNPSCMNCAYSTERIQYL